MDQLLVGGGGAIIGGIIVKVIDLIVGLLRHRMDDRHKESQDARQDRDQAFHQQQEIIDWLQGQMQVQDSKFKELLREQEARLCAEIDALRKENTQLKVQDAEQKAEIQQLQKQAERDQARIKELEERVKQYEVRVQ